MLYFTIIVIFVIVPGSGKVLPNHLQRLTPISVKKPEDLVSLSHNRLKFQHHSPEVGSTET